MSKADIAAFKRIVDPNQVKKNHVIIEELSQALTDSIFKTEYAQAATAIAELIKYNEDRAKECNAAYRDRKASYKENLTEYQTAIPFIGDRGTGKSSAMRTVLEWLRNEESAEEKGPCTSCNPNKTKDFLSLVNAPACGEYCVRCSEFICLDMIDINSMRPNENIMTIILAQMLRYLMDLEKQPRMDSYRAESPYPDFRDLYRNINMLTDVFSEIYEIKSSDESEIGLSWLQRVSDHRNSVRLFRELVQDFTHEVQKTKGWKHKCYLVLALDDVDMYKGSSSKNQSAQFALLEHIYDYLRVPNLIVLLTFNERILRRNCMKHFQQTYFEQYDGQQLSNSDLEEVSILAQQYLAKLFPHEQRIYMPDFLVVNARGTTELHIIPTQDGKNRIAPFQSLDPVSAKEFVLRLIADRTGVYFDICGEKKHFLEPRNLRELGTMIPVILSWEDPTGQNEAEAIRARNRWKLLNYLRNQFAGERLTPEEYRKFQRLSTVPFAQQGQMLVDEIHRYRKNAAKAEDDLGNLPLTHRDRWRYSYGELLHNLFFSTRVYNGEIALYNREYVHCVLSVNSVLLNQLLYEYKIAEEDEQGRIKKSILEIIGSSIGGRWVNDMLPRFSVKKESGLEKLPISSVGSISLPIERYLEFELPNDIQEIFLGMYNPSKGQPSYEKCICQFAEALAVLGMFFTGYPSTGLKCWIKSVLKTDYDVSTDSKNQNIFLLHSDSSNEICFNALNPFLNFYGFQPPKGDSASSYYEYIVDKIKKLTIKDYKKEWLSAIEDKIRANEAYKASSSVVQRGSLKEQMQQKGIDRLKEFYKKYSNVEGSAEVNICDYSRKLVLFKETAAQDIDNAPRLPIQHFDMMYNIMKRLSDVSNRNRPDHNIPEEAEVEEAYQYFVSFYKDIAEELKKQDDVYNPEIKMSEEFQHSFFYQAFTKSEDKKAGNYYNPYVKELFTRMLTAAISNKKERGMGTGFSTTKS